MACFILIFLFFSFFVFCFLFLFLFLKSDPEFSPKSYRYGEYDSEEGAWTSPPCSGVWVNPATGIEETRDFEWTNNV